MTSRIVCTRRLEFDAAHRIIGHEGKCKDLHGHRYALEATFLADKLDSLGRVVDFGIIREKLGGWLDEYWDHTAVLSEEDRELGNDICKHTKQTIFYLPANPTAENMAAYIFEVICPVLFKNSGLKCISITLHETPNCKVTVS